MILKGSLGKGKYYLEYLKDLRICCRKMYGFGWFIATPKVRMVLIDAMNEFLNDLVYPCVKGLNKNGTRK